MEIGFKKSNSQTRVSEGVGLHFWDKVDISGLEKGWFKFRDEDSFVRGFSLHADAGDDCRVSVKMFGKFGDEDENGNRASKLIEEVFPVASIFMEDGRIMIEVLDRFSGWTREEFDEHIEFRLRDKNKIRIREG